MSGNQPFIQLNGPGAAQQNHPPRQQHSPPMRQPGNGGAWGGMPPQQQQQQGPPPPPMHHPPGNLGMGQHGGHGGHGGPAVPLPPPPHIVPNDLRGRQKVEICDLRSETMTEADARELLSTYTVYRFEKANRVHDVDEEGFPVIPSWEKATRVEQTDLSKLQATRQVRDLQRSTPPAAEKKGTLSPNIQRQIERAKDDLERTEPDPRYEHVLAQLAWVDRKMEQQPIEYLMEKKKKGKKVYHEVSKKHKPKRKMERVSVTAYFKRAPRSDVSAMNMLRDQEHQRESQMRPLHPPQHMPQPPMNPGPPPQALMQPPQPPMNPHPNGPPPAMRQDRGNMGNPHSPVILDKHNRPVKIAHFSPRSSRDSLSSDEGWSSPGESDLTPESSVSSRSRYNHEKRRDRSRGRSPHRHRPEYFGQQGNRRHSKHDQDFAIQQLPPRVLMQPPQRPLSHAFEVQTPWDEPYYDDFDNRAALRARPRALAPAVIQAPVGIRRVPAHEARREIYAEDLDRIQDGLERLQMDDDRRREREYQRDQDARFEQEADLLRGRRLQERLRRDLYDEPISPGLDRSWPERSAQQYVHRRERSAERENPFSPRRPIF